MRPIRQGCPIQLPNFLVVVSAGVVIYTSYDDQLPFAMAFPKDVSENAELPIPVCMVSRGFGMNATKSLKSQPARTADPKHLGGMHVSYTNFRPGRARDETYPRHLVTALELRSVFPFEQFSAGQVRALLDQKTLPFRANRNSCCVPIQLLHWQVHVGTRVYGQHVAGAR